MRARTGRLAPPVLRPARGQAHRRGLVLVPEVDAPLRQIVGRQLEAHPVPCEDGDAMLPHLARHVGDHHVAVLQRHAVARIGEHLVDGAFHFDQRLFCHVITPSTLPREGNQTAFRSTADVLPFCPRSSSYEIFWCSLKLPSPARSTAETCTNTSFDLSSG